ncbi:MAG: hypothetical protein HYX37_02125 [Rhizobiales bacterium]|nr:hypothetical protein [Hyphomicrobiales bacterium]
MAKKARKKSAAKRGKKSKPAKKKKAAKRVTRRKAKRKTIGERLSRGYHTVVDTVKGTDRLRNKLEPPGTSETA